MIYNELFDWQKEIVNKYQHKTRFGFFLDMGLGKTPISLAMAEINKCDKILIITLNSKATENESISGSFHQWASKIDGMRIIHKHKPNFNLNNKECFIINYESIISRKNSKNVYSDVMEKFILSCKNQKVAVILDESHKIKSLNSKQSKASKKIITMLEFYSLKTYVYLLTGTPFTQGFIDLYSQLKVLGYTQNKNVFMDNYCIRGRVPGLLEWQQPIVGYKNIDNLFKVLHNYAITTMSKEVINLPEQVFIYHKLNKTNTMDLISYEKLKDFRIVEELISRKSKNLYTKGMPNPFYRNLGFPDEKYLAYTAGLFYLRSRQASIGFQGNALEADWYDESRFDEIRKFLKENEDNYVIFYNYTPELYKLYEICEELGYKIDIYCGEVKSLKFYEAYEKMTNSEKINADKRVIISNFSSGSTGKNWQEYNHCIMSSLPVYKDYAQALKRQHRIGQSKPVFYHIFYQNNYLDNSMLESLKKKENYNEDMFKFELSKSFNTFIT